jgi:serine/threonine-protein kinase
MAEHPEQQSPSSRPRTATRMRYVAPPGFVHDERLEPVQKIGRYEILEVLGKGAMGVVYKARDPMLDRTVAVKTIVSPRGQGKRVRRAYLERFEREAKAAAKMQHPAIVTIFDVGLDDGLPFMVLEYLPGESLADRLDRVRMPLGRGVQIALDLASALGFAHKERIVHRDVKPANVLHAGEMRWKLADFGIARMPDSDLTQVGIFMGTPGYAPPEAISQGQYTSQADVFAWGAVLYELLSGRIPYEGPDTRTTNGYVLKMTAKPPTVFDASIPEPLAEVAMRALHPSTETRYRDGAEAEDALREAWELCLHSNMITPAALTSHETPHERAAKEFHATGAPAGSGHPKMRDTHADRVGDAAELVIEARRKSSDDDPTRIYSQKNQEMLIDRARGSTAPSANENKSARLIEAQAHAAIGRPGQQTPAFELLHASGRSSLHWVAALLVLLLAAGGVAAYLFLLR